MFTFVYLSHVPLCSRLIVGKGLIRRSYSELEWDLNWEYFRFKQLVQANLYKFKHNFRDALDAMCPSNDGVENEEHFLLLCPSFDTQRRCLLDRALPLIRPLGFINPSNELLTHILFYGCKDFPAVTNRELLQGIISFIRETGRFD